MAFGLNMKSAHKPWHYSVGLGLAAVIFVILITAVCGWLFNCGCTWPWRGFVEHCNAFDPGAKEKCPWCADSFIKAVNYLKSL
jgi:hypothetical protein